MVASSPYPGWLRWHHYAGLLFGVVTFTWTFSGLLSMDPFPQLDTGGATPAQRTAVQGPPTPARRPTAPPWLPPCGWLAGRSRPRK